MQDVFQLYNKFERTKSYIMVCSSLLFWAALAFDVSSHFVRPSHRAALFTLSRVTNFFGSLVCIQCPLYRNLVMRLNTSNLIAFTPEIGEKYVRISPTDKLES